MTNLSNTWRPSPAAQKAILAAQQAAQERLKVAAEFLFRNKLPEGGVLHQMRIASPAGNPHVKLSLRVLWPGELQVLRAGVEVLESASLADAHWRMPDRLQQWRATCPADKVLMKAYMRRAHTTPVRLVLDASGVLRVFHARTDKVLAMSAAGNPFKLSPDFKALTFHDLMPSLR